MEILKLTIDNFKCFQGPHTIDFRNFGPGIYYLAGKNYLDGDLGQNGAGKSTVWDALHWCLYGESLRGIKTTKLIPADVGGKPIVSVLIKQHGKSIKITRSYKPGRIIWRTKAGSEDITQEDLDDRIGLTSGTFRNSIVIDQFSRMFFELRPREKMDVFTELLNLDYWLEKASEAGSTLRVLRGDIQDLEVQIENLLGRKQEIRNQLNDLREGPKGATLEKQKAIRSAKIHELEKEQNILEKLKADHEKETEKNRPLSERIAKLCVDFNKKTETIRKLDGDARVAKADVNHIKEELAGFQDSAANVCPTCGQTMDAKDFRIAVRGLRRKLSNAEKDFENISVQYEYAVSDRERINQARTEAQDKMSRRTRADQVLKRFEATKRKIQTLEVEVEVQDELVTAARDRAREHKGKIQRLTKRLSANWRKRKRLSRELREKQKLANQVGYWVKGFKDVRLFEIKDALQSLEVEVNSYLADLGMNRWEVQIEAEKVTRKGSVTRGLNIMVDPGNAKGAMPWEAWSGGEGQRLSLAGTLALSQTILRYMQTSSNIQVWDEKLFWLSGAGEANMLELLQEIAKRENRQIWIIDQHNLDFPFDGVLTVVKDENGSRFEL